MTWVPKLLLPSVGDGGKDVSKKRNLRKKRYRLRSYKLITWGKAGRGL